MPRSFQTKKKKSSIPKKNKGKHQIDGKIFSTKGAKDLYGILLAHKKSGLIHQFELPEVGEETKNKFGSKKCIINDIKFDSMLEGRFFLHLLTMQQQNNISCIVTHPKYQLQKSFKKYDKTIRAIDYFADFEVEFCDGTKVIYDTKGRETADFKIKRKMFDYKYPDLTLICVKQIRGVWVNKDTEEELPFACN